MPPPSSGADYTRLSNHPSLRQTTRHNGGAAPAPTTSNAYTTSTTYPYRHTSNRRPNRCEYCLLHRRGCDGARPQCGECKKRDIECVMPTTGEETISRSEMQRRVAERQERELEAQGLVEVEVPDAVEEEEDDGNDDDVEMLEDDTRQQEPVRQGLTEFRQRAQWEEDLFALGSSRRRPDDFSRAPTRKDDEESDVDEAELVRQGATRRQLGDQLLGKRKRTPEGERIRRNAIRVARTAGAVGAIPPEPEEEGPLELALGENGVVTVTNQPFVHEQSVDIEDVTTDIVETDNALPSATESVFDATSRPIRDHNSNLQALDRSARGTTTQMDLNWSPQTPRRPDGSQNPNISADAAHTFLPAEPQQGEQADTPISGTVRQVRHESVLPERDTSLEELDANEAEVADELTRARAGEMHGDAGQHFDEAFAAGLGAEQLTNHLRPQHKRA